MECEINSTSMAESHSFCVRANTQISQANGIRKLFPLKSKILCLADCLRSVHDHFGWCQIASVAMIYFRLIYLTRKTASTEWFSHAFKVHSFQSIRSVCDSRFIHIKSGRRRWWCRQREECKLNAERRRAKWRGPTEKISPFIRTEKKNMYFIPFYSFLTQYLHIFFLLLIFRALRLKCVCVRLVVVLHSLSRSSFLIHFVCKLCELESVCCVRRRKYSHAFDRAHIHYEIWRM